MYLDNVKIKVIGNDYDKNNKPFKIDTHNFNFNDGIQAKDLSRFLEDMQDSLTYKVNGKVSVNIEIDATEE